MATLEHNLHFRWMSRKNWPEVLAIEKEVFEFPWTADDLHECMKKKNCIGLVGFKDRSFLAGYLIYEYYDNYFELLSLVIRKELHRQGYGRAFVDHFKKKLCPETRQMLQTTVREKNLPALKFFSNQGFIAIDIKKNSYQCSDEDGIIMRFWEPWRTIALPNLSVEEPVPIMPNTFEKLSKD